MTTEAWRNRIVGMGEEAPDQLLANPRNWRIHPKGQQDVMAGALAEVGWVTGVIVNQRTGFVVDGHLRVALAISHNEATIPVQYVDLDEREEAIVLASLDPISAMAGRDDGLLAELVAGIEVGDNALAALLAEANGAAEETAFPMLPEGDRSPFRTMTFTVTADQEGVIIEALRRAKEAAPFVDTGNENSNGNALARLAETYR